MSDDHRSNQLNQIRPESTFANFKVYHPQQKPVVDAIKGLADQIIDHADSIASEEYPFPYGQVISIWGEPGHGKSHLLEAFAGHILANAPQLAGSLYLARGSFTLRHIGGVNLYDKRPIVLIDDLFAEKQSVNALNAHTDIQCMMDYLASVYERRTLVITTSNFPMFSQQELGNVGVDQLIARVDKVGRTLSRCKELFSTAGQMHLAGHDYRETKAQERKAGRGFLRFPVNAGN
jgi:DNA replication protein DnaC